MVYHCELCNRYCPGELLSFEWDLHNNGKRHQKRENERRNKTIIWGRVVDAESYRRRSTVLFKHQPWVHHIESCLYWSITLSEDDTKFNLTIYNQLCYRYYLREQCALVELAVLKCMVLQKFDSMQDMREYGFLFDRSFYPKAFLSDVRSGSCYRILVHVVPFLKSNQVYIR